MDDRNPIWMTIMNATCGYGDFSDKNMGEILANADILFE